MKLICIGDDLGGHWGLGFLGLKLNEGYYTPLIGACGDRGSGSVWVFILFIPLHVVKG